MNTKIHFAKGACALFLLFFLAKSFAQTTVPHVLDSMLDKRLRDQRNTLGVKGLSAAIRFSDGTVWEGVAGVSSLLPVDSIQPNYLFNIGSVTKTITAGCILQMAQEGLLSLDDKLHQHLDTFNNINPNITVRQLLRHQSGIFDVVTHPDFNVVMNSNLDSIWQIKSAVQSFVGTPLFQPGAAWSYSNTNYLLLGMIIEKISGQLYNEEIHERFFGPLGLSTFAHPPFNNLPLPVANVWLNLVSPSFTSDAGDYIAQWDNFNSAMGPSGCWFATAADLARWMHAYQSSEVLSDSMLLQCRATVPSQPSGVNYGLGIMERKFLNQTAYGHGGDLGYCANAYYFPGKDLSISVINNDALKNSWQVAPTVQVLLKAVMDYMMLTPANEPIAGPMVTKTDIQVFPNPITSEFEIDAILPEQYKSVQCEMVNSFGVTICTFPNVVPNGRTIHTPLRLGKSMPQGVYFLKLYGDGQCIGTKRIVIIE